MLLARWRWPVESCVLKERRSLTFVMSNTHQIMISIPRTDLSWLRSALRPQLHYRSHWTSQGSCDCDPLSQDPRDCDRVQTDEE